jgi:uncharacterized membrane protein
VSPALLIPIALLALLALLLYRRLVRAPGYTSPALRIGAVVTLVTLSAAIIVASPTREAPSTVVRRDSSAPSG